MRSLTTTTLFQSLFVFVITTIFQTLAVASPTTYSDCYDDWAIKVYDYHDYRGDYECYRPGEYIAGKTCESYYGKKISFKIRKGYYICFYDKHGRQIRRYDKHVNYYPYGFYKLCIFKVGHGGGGYDNGGHHNGGGYDDHCYDDWSVKLYNGHHYNGGYKCFRPGEYYAGKDCGNYYGKKISFKIRKGYYVCFYNRYGKLIKKCYGDVDYYPYGFTKFCILKEGHGGGGYDNGHHNGGGYDDHCYDDWCVKLYDNHHYNGGYKCYRIGEYYAGKDCGNYYGKKISFKIRKGYYVCFYNKYGKLIKKCYGDVDYYPYGFTKFCILKEGHGGGRYPGNAHPDSGGHGHNNDWGHPNLRQCILQRTTPFIWWRYLLRR